jgi:hypothetical protein
MFSKKRGEFRDKEDNKMERDCIIEAHPASMH